MIVRRLEELRGSDDEVDNGPWISRRFILRQDEMGHSVHETFIRPTRELRMHYRHHLETVYCIGGHGEVVDLKKNETHEIYPGTLYALTSHHAHILRAFDEGLRLVCVFTPALVGPETHQEDGSYPLLNRDGSVRHH